MGIPSAPETNQQTITQKFTVTADATVPLFVANGACDVESVAAVFEAAVATHATNFITYAVRNLGVAATGTTLVAGTNYTGVATDGGVAIAKWVPVTMTVVPAAKRLADGEVLYFHWDEATTDVADATVTVTVRYTQVTAPDQG